ncbi:MAG: SEC-C metal-binding domain-containing protein [Syntrophaceae bacterium]
MELEALKQLLASVDINPDEIFPMQILAGLISRGYPAQEVMRILAMEDAFARAGRNDPCPCGSGLKFKRCHGQKRT